MLDNYATHKHEKVRRWLRRNKRVHPHFTPTSSSWLNLVERFFALLSEQRLRRGAFTSVCHLEKSLKQYLDTYNENPRPLRGRSRPRKSSKRSAVPGRNWRQPFNRHYDRDTTLGCVGRDRNLADAPIVSGVGGEEHVACFHR